MFYIYLDINLEQRYTNDRKNKLDYIINHPQHTKLQKLKLLINELYLSDMLNLILKTTQFKIKEIDEIFYNILLSNIKCVY